MRRNTSSSNRQQQQQQQQQQDLVSVDKKERPILPGGHPRRVVSSPPSSNNSRNSSRNNSFNSNHMGTDAYEKSHDRKYDKKSVTSRYRPFRWGMILVAGICIWSQAHSYITLRGLPGGGSDDTVSTTVSTTVENLRARGTRGLMSLMSSLTDVDEDSTTPVSNPNHADDEAHELEKAKLKALAEKAKAEAEMAKLETEKLRLEVEQAKLDVKRAKKEAEDAVAASKVAQDKANAHAERADKHKAAAEKAEAHAQSMKAEIQAKHQEAADQAREKAESVAKITDKKVAVTKQEAETSIAKAKKEHDNAASTEEEGESEESNGMPNLEEAKANTEKAQAKFDEARAKVEEAKANGDSADIKALEKAQLQAKIAWKHAVREEREVMTALAKAAVKEEKPAEEEKVDKDEKVETVTQDSKEDKEEQPEVKEEHNDATATTSKDEDKDENESVMPNLEQAKAETVKAEQKWEEIRTKWEKAKAKGEDKAEIKRLEKEQLKYKIAWKQADRAERQAAAVVAKAAAMMTELIEEQQQQEEQEKKAEEEEEATVESKEEEQQPQQQEPDHTTTDDEELPDLEQAKAETEKAEKKFEEAKADLVAAKKKGLDETEINSLEKEQLKAKIAWKNAGRAERAAAAAVAKAMKKQREAEPMIRAKEEEEQKAKQEEMKAQQEELAAKVEEFEMKKEELEYKGELKSKGELDSRMEEFESMVEEAKVKMEEARAKVEEARGKGDGKQIKALEKEALQAKIAWKHASRAANEAAASVAQARREQEKTATEGQDSKEEAKAKTEEHDAKKEEVEAKKEEVEDKRDELEAKVVVEFGSKVEEAKAKFKEARAKVEEAKTKGDVAEIKAREQEALQVKIAWKHAARAARAEREAAKKKKELVVPAGPIYEDEESTIREWGCARNETPFIFVHIGKAGGGGARSRMAAAALEYNRSAWYRTHEDPSYYYPVYDEKGQLHKGKFSSSQMTNWVPKNFSQVEKDFSYEGFGPCAASTPLGQALTCPMPTGLCGEDGDRCDLVYMGHNVLGSELHWLPTEYLRNWWLTTKWGRRKDDFIKYMIRDRFNGGGGEFGEWEFVTKARRLMKYHYPESVCPPGPLTYRQHKRNYDKCASPKENWMDELTQYETGMDPVSYGSKVIASMPVMRVTVLREPFSWLTSKFFWHPYHYLKDGNKVSPDAGKAKNDALIKEAEQKSQPAPNFVKCDDIDQATEGWASFRALTYIFYLCGEHCMGGYIKGTMSIEDMERQAAYNLRHSFAVVGLLHKTDDFYNMVSQRVYYMDMSLNPLVSGKMHRSGNHDEATRCKEVYQDPEFQTKMMAKSPTLAALYRLYQIAVEVNQFQEQELAQCSSTSVA